MKKYILISDDFKIRPPSDKDINLLNEAILSSFKSLHKWMDWAKKPQTIEETKSFIEYAKNCWDKKFPQELPCLIFDIHENSLIGSIALNSINWEIPSFEIGYWINERFSRQGYITKATSVLTHFAFSELNANRVQICCDCENTPSANIPKKLGFMLEAKLKNHRINKSTGKISDTLIFSRFNMGEIKKNYEVEIV